MTGDSPWSPSCPQSSLRRCLLALCSNTCFYINIYIYIYIHISISLSLSILWNIASASRLYYDVFQLSLPIFCITHLHKHVILLYIFSCTLFSINDMEHCAGFPSVHDPASSLKQQPHQGPCQINYNITFALIFNFARIASVSPTRGSTGQTL